MERAECGGTRLCISDLSVNSNLPDKRHSIFDNDLDKIREVTLWQAVIKVLITFVVVPCIKEIHTFKLSEFII